MSVKLEDLIWPMSFVLKVEAVYQKVQLLPESPISDPNVRHGVVHNFLKMLEDRFPNRRFSGDHVVIEEIPDIGGVRVYWSPPKRQISADFVGGPWDGGSTVIHALGSPYEVVVHNVEYFHLATGYDDLTMVRDDKTFLYHAYGWNPCTKHWVFALQGIEDDL
jgi:hypothetical protein